MLKVNYFLIGKRQRSRITPLFFPTRNQGCVSNFNSSKSQFTNNQFSITALFSNFIGNETKSLSCFLEASEIMDCVETSIHSQSRDCYVNRFHWVVKADNHLHRPAKRG